jgi:hypothetical protein
MATTTDQKDEHGLTRAMRMMMRVWAGNDPVRERIVWLAVVEREPQRKIAKRVATSHTWVGKQTRDFFTLLAEAAKREGMTPEELGEFCGVEVRVEE